MFLEKVAEINAEQQLQGAPVHLLNEIDEQIIDHIAADDGEDQARAQIGPVGHVALRHIINIRRCDDTECDALSPFYATFIKEYVNRLHAYSTDKDTAHLFALINDDENELFTLLKKFGPCYQGVRTLLKRLGILATN